MTKQDKQDKRDTEEAAFALKFLIDAAATVIAIILLYQFGVFGMIDATVNVLLGL
jgi:hypothetical protein